MGARGAMRVSVTDTREPLNAGGIGKSGWMKGIVTPKLSATFTDGDETRCDGRSH